MKGKPMETETLNAAAKLGGLETVELVDGYDRSKHPHKMLFRRFTLDDIKALTNSYSRELWFEANDGKARRLRVSSQLKTWKRDPNRFECSFKYGLYENVRFDRDEMLRRLLVEVS